MVPEYGDPNFDKGVIGMFDSGEEFVADVEQARVLWDHGWDVLDVRDEHEIDFFGDFPNPPPGTIGGCFETIVVSGPHKVRVIPMVTSTGYRFDSAAGGKVFANKTRNAGFKEAIAAAFPNKDEAKIMVSCSDGRQRAVAALDQDGGMSDVELEECRAALKAGRPILVDPLAFPGRKPEDRAAVQSRSVELTPGQALNLGGADVENALVLR